MIHVGHSSVNESANYNDTSKIKKLIDIRSNQVALRIIKKQIDRMTKNDLLTEPDDRILKGTYYLYQLIQLAKSKKIKLGKSIMEIDSYFNNIKEDK